MSLVTGPTYTFETTTDPFAPGDAFELLGSVIYSEIPAMVFETPDLGDPIVFDDGAAPHILPVPVPRLAGLDEVEVASASFKLASARYEKKQSVAAGSPSEGAVILTLSGLATGQVVSLLKLTVTGLVVPPSGSTSYALRGGNRTVYWTTDSDSGETVSQTTSPGGTVHHLHLLIRPRRDSGTGPPSAAVPHFAMPGDGSSLYGPALGGAILDVQVRSGGRADLTVTLSPPQAMSGCEVLIGTGKEISAHDGLPNEVAPVTTWSADNIEGTFDLRPKGITVTAHAGAMDPEAGSLVAQFDTDPGGLPREIDFAPVARAILADGYPTSQGSDLGLALRVAVDTPCALYLQLGSVAVRYVHRPMPEGDSLDLRGAPEVLTVPVPAGLRPMGLSFRADGRYGPARLAGDADETPATSRQGYRVAGPARIARRLALSPKESTLPLARLGVFGRGSEDGELLLCRHGGDGLRIGPPLGAPVSLPFRANEAASWHRAEIGAVDGLPPHPDALWVVVQATKGVFWWHADLGVPAGAEQTLVQRSEDDGTTWRAVGGRALLQAWVTEVDPATREPAPLLPLPLSWNAGILNGDLVGVDQGVQSSEFTRLWLAEGTAHEPLFDGIAALDRDLSLILACRRDADISVSDLVLTYDPWTAEEV